MPPKSSDPVKFDDNGFPLDPFHFLRTAEFARLIPLLINPETFDALHEMAPEALLAKFRDAVPTLVSLSLTLSPFKRLTSFSRQRTPAPGRTGSNPSYFADSCTRSVESFDAWDPTSQPVLYTWFLSVSPTSR